MSNDTEVQAAMTPDEWKTWRQEGHITRNGKIVLHSKGIGFAGLPRISAYMMPMDTETHACAAVCLDGQPYGFTHEDVKALSRCADNAERWASARLYDPEDHAAHERTRTIIQRLAALLPPNDHDV